MESTNEMKYTTNELVQMNVNDEFIEWKGLKTLKEIFKSADMDCGMIVHVYNNIVDSKRCILQVHQFEYFIESFLAYAPINVDIRTIYPMKKIEERLESMETKISEFMKNITVKTEERVFEEEEPKTMSKVEVKQLLLNYNVQLMGDLMMIMKDEKDIERVRLLIKNYCDDLDTDDFFPGSLSQTADYISGKKSMEEVVMNALDKMALDHRPKEISDDTFSSSEIIEDNMDLRDGISPNSTLSKTLNCSTYVGLPKKDDEKKKDVTMEVLEEFQKKLSTSSIEYEKVELTNSTDDMDLTAEEKEDLRILAPPRLVEQKEEEDDDGDKEIELPTERQSLNSSMGYWDNMFAMENRNRSPIGRANRREMNIDEETQKLIEAKLQSMGFIDKLYNKQVLLSQDYDFQSTLDILISGRPLSL
ncbi:hypothetical protein SNEBB_010925 [Seison nebaliae]|nr:hypothetical protein SNEBB_010925 [Seison nebaliae]